MEREAERSRWWHTAILRHDMRLVAGRDAPDPTELHLIEASERRIGAPIEGDITALKCLLGNRLT